MIWKSKYFCGNEISRYGLENGYVDYGTLAKSFDAVLCNNILSVYPDFWEKENGWIDNSDEIDEIREEIENLEEQRETLEENASDFCNVCTADCNGYCEWDRIQRKIENLENEIQEKEEGIERLEEEQENNDEVFQFFIISDNGASILKDYTNEIVWYNGELDLYVWGVTHYGTAWDYVLTDIKIKLDDDNDE